MEEINWKDMSKFLSFLILLAKLQYKLYFYHNLTKSY